MNELLNRFQQLLQSLAGRREVYWLLALLVVWLLVRQIPKMFGGTKRKPETASPLDFDVQTLAPPVAGVDELVVRVYHVPVRVGLVVIAPLGRDAPLPGRGAIRELLDQAIPGLGTVMQHDQPQLRLWPAQLSASGFVHSLARHVKVPGEGGKNSLWCLVAGRVLASDRPFMVGLALCATEPNSLGVITVESEHKWLDVLRIVGS